jgi:hypothetical protein
MQIQLELSRKMHPCTASSVDAHVARMRSLKRNSVELLRYAYRHFEIIPCDLLDRATAYALG